MMKRLCYISILLLTVSFAFSQNLTVGQISQLQSQSSGGVSAVEIAAAREALKNQSNNYKNLIIKADSGVIDSAFSLEKLMDSSFSDSNIFKSKRKTELKRYENIIFSKSIPNAFYEIQGSVSADYPIKPGDYLELSLWGAVERQLALSVNNQGNVFIEGVGLVNVLNLTLGDAERLLTKKLQSVYSGIAQGRISVNLRTTKLAPTKVFAMGSVQRPGGYDLPGNANVFLALYRAGGPDDIGSVRNIIIRRANGDSTIIDLYDFILKGLKAGEGILRDGDLIFVPKAKKLVKATGAIGRPAIYELKEDEKLSDLLSFAGGLRPNIDHTINLWRIGKKGAPEVFEPGMAKDFLDSSKAFQMQNGDSVFVFESSRQNENSIKVAGAVFYPGFYAWADNLMVGDAVKLAGGAIKEAFTERVIVERINPDSSFSYFSDNLGNSKGLKLQPNDVVIVLDSRVLKNLRTVSVAGYVKNPKEFEWQDSINAIDLIALCGGFLQNAYKKEILIERIVPNEYGTKQIRVAINGDLSIKNNELFILEPGDRIFVEIDDSFYEQELITIAGAFKNAGVYSLANRGETFKAFMKRVAKLDSEAYIKGGQIFRETTKETEPYNPASIARYEAGFQDSADIARQGLMQQGPMQQGTARQGLTQQSAARQSLMQQSIAKQGLMQQSADEQQSFTQKSIERGRIAFDFERVLKGKDKDITLQANDSIYIPYEMVTVNVTGDVISPGHVIWQKGWDVKDYINAAGGLSITGDEERIILTYANGQKTNANKAKIDPDPGSTIHVSYKPLPEPTKMVEVIQVVGGIATALSSIVMIVVLIVTN